MSPELQFLTKFIELLRDQGRLLDHHYTQKALDVDKNSRASWSSDRASGWLPIPGGRVPRNNLSRELVGATTSACTVRSAVLHLAGTKLSAHLIALSRLRRMCGTPLTSANSSPIGPIAADICHQPDMAHLHGFYLSPAASKRRMT